MGGLIMTACAALINITMLVSYMRVGTDWLGVNILEDIKTNGEERMGRFDRLIDDCFDRSIILTVFEPFVYAFYIPSTRFFRIVLWALRKNDLFAYILLNIAQDPFVTTVFLRHGLFGKLRRKDWIVFCSSILFSNLYWIIRNTILVEVVKAAWKIISS